MGPKSTMMCSAFSSIWRMRSKKLRALAAYSTPTPSRDGTETPSSSDNLAMVSILESSPFS